MKIHVLTLFPEMFESFLSVSILGRAIEKGFVSVDFVQIRDFALDRYKHVDDTPFGGGKGMVMKLLLPFPSLIHHIDLSGS